MSIELFRQIVSVNDGEVFTTSGQIAEVFGKRHDNVIRAIENLDCSNEFAKLNYEVCFENSNLQNNKPLKYYRITKDGMAFLVMGFKGKEAAKFKEAYINAFNWMVDNIRKREELDREINDFSRRESLSISSGSFHGRGLAQRRIEKQKLSDELKDLQQRIQMVLPALEAN